MSVLEQYRLLLALVLGIAATVFVLYGLARAIGPGWARDRRGISPPTSRSQNKIKMTAKQGAG